jgi:hypothetical protein
VVRYGFAIRRRSQADGGPERATRDGDQIRIGITTYL